MLYELSNMSEGLVDTSSDESATADQNPGAGTGGVKCPAHFVGCVVSEVQDGHVGHGVH